jgi:ribosomal protein L37AE/L43A
MKPEIKFCPNCAKDLSDNKKLAQGIKECKHCGTRFLILITSINNNKDN